MYGFFWDDKKVYLIMELAQGGDVYQELKSEGRFSESKAANYIFQTVQALKYMH